MNGGERGRRNRSSPEAGEDPEPQGDGGDQRARLMLRQRMLQRKAGNAPIAQGADQAIDRAGRGSGEALPTAVRAKFERSLRADLSDVRVHTGSDSSTSAEAVGARAYTVGRDIHFAAGEFQPGSREGQELLAHEVVHTQQQRSGGRAAQLKPNDSKQGDQGDDDSAHEQDADKKAKKMADGESADGASGKADEKPHDKSHDKPHDKHKQKGVETTAFGTLSTGDTLITHTKNETVNGNTADVLQGDQLMQKMLPSLKERVAAVEGLPATAPADPTAEIAANTTPEIQGAAKDMELSDEQNDAMQFALQETQDQLQNAADDIEDARDALKSAGNSARARSLERKVQDKKEAVDHGLVIVTKLVEMGVAIATEDPEELIAPITELTGTLASLNTDWGDSDADAASDKADRSAIDEAEAKLGHAHKKAERAQHRFKEASDLVQRFARTYQRNRAEAEGKYDQHNKHKKHGKHDKHTDPKFKFAELVKQREEVAKLNQELQGLLQELKGPMTSLDELRSELERALSGSSDENSWVDSQRDQFASEKATLDAYRRSPRFGVDFINDAFWSTSEKLTVLDAQRERADKALVESEPPASGDKQEQKGKHKGKHKEK